MEEEKKKKCKRIYEDMWQTKEIVIVVDVVYDLSTK